MRLTDLAPAHPALSAVRTLIIPTVSAANLPQLACELLIHTHALPRLAIVTDAGVVPAVGADALLGGQAHALSAGCELFCDGSVAVLQLRSPLAAGAGPAFARRVHEWARRALGGARVIWLHASLTEEVGGGLPQQHAGGPAGSEVDWAMAGAEAGALAAALQQVRWGALPADDARREAGGVVHGLLDAAAETAGAPEIAVLCTTTLDWNAVPSAVSLATALSALLAALAEGEQPAGSPLAGVNRKVGLAEWRQPPSWAGLML
ncbi:hypothetical protein T492DRAFT_15108 [Pavlovales sp. CCMP2436]|nr:hypothetical protein T492DRAFT_15108 [Pavlovales sp. CCMP2436]|mmetsp:Transcript_216/g.586  ORF Transcript_216/g.586 Transcript_216/m.586 type:complete len:263 (-) Transcript_216:359-1147(-)